MSRFARITSFFIFVGLQGLACLLPGAPNIVFILADDMGYGDVHALNPKSKIPTPNLDRLAREGMTFTDAHTGSAVCTPTRYGLITGRYSWRGRLKSGVLDGYGEPLIEEGRLNVASFLKNQGYRTGIVGKWHLGLGWARAEDRDAYYYSHPVTDGPHTRGFDFSYIIPASLDFPPYVYIRDGRATTFPSILQAAQPFPKFVREGPRATDLDMPQVLDDLTAQAASFVRRHARDEQPFFLYFPLTAPHKPAWPHERFVGSTKLGPYGDFVVQVDSTVGEVLQALDDSGIAGNTLIIYTSDNGSYMYRLDDPAAEDHVSDPSIQSYRASHHTSNHIFRGTKADVWEAGHHVPFFARWPGTVSAGGKADATICLTDFFATVAEITGGELPNDAAEDSFSLLPLLKGGSPKAPRAPVIHHSANGMFAIRDGNWKLVAGNGSGGREKPLGKPFERPYELYDLAQDPSEKKNVIDSHPDVAKKLEQKLEQLRSSGRSR